VGFHTYDRGTYLEDLSDEAIEVVTDHLPRKNSPLSALLFYRLDQAYSQVGQDDTAFSGGRSPRFAVFIVAVCPTPSFWPPTVRGSVPSGRRCARTPSVPAATSMR